jgi:hypothetical protein
VCKDVNRFANSLPSSLFSGSTSPALSTRAYPTAIDFTNSTGKTYRIRSLFATPKILTISPENPQNINNSINDWGAEPVRRPAMEYFCGLGVITSDTPIWQHSRKLLRPTFDKSNKSDLTTLSIQVESLMVKLPVEGSSVDLQPLIFLTVSFRDWGPG